LRLPYGCSGRIRTVPVLITDTAFTAPAGPGWAQDIAVRAFMAGILLPVAGRPGFRA
jgi:hypothetical protein